MLAIKQWAFSLCAAMVAAGLAHMLLPKSNMEKVMRLVLSVFFLCCLLSPAVLRDPSLMVDIRLDSEGEIAARSQKVSELAEQQTLNMASSSLEQLIREKLSQKGINVDRVTINIIPKGQSDLQLESVEVVVDAAHQDQARELVAELEAELGASVRLEFE